MKIFDHSDDRAALADVPAFGYRYVVIDAFAQRRFPFGPGQINRCFHCGFVEHECHTVRADFIRECAPGDYFDVHRVDEAGVHHIHGPIRKIFCGKIFRTRQS